MRVTIYRYGCYHAVYAAGQLVLVAEILHGYEDLLLALGHQVDVHDIELADVPVPKGWRAPSPSAVPRPPASLLVLERHLAAVTRERLLAEIERRREELAHLEAEARAGEPLPEKVAGAYTPGSGI